MPDLVEVENLLSTGWVSVFTTHVPDHLGLYIYEHTYLLDETWSKTIQEGYAEATDSWLHGGLPFESYLVNLRKLVGECLLDILSPEDLIDILVKARSTGQKAGREALRSELGNLLFTKS